MLKGIDLNQRFEWSASIDTEEPKTVFVLRPLSAAEKVSLNTVFPGGKITGASIIDFLDLVVVEIKNFGEPDKKTALRSLPLDALNELILEANKLANLGVEEKKT